jgi:hypothetical protein
MGAVVDDVREVHVCLHSGTVISSAVMSASDGHKPSQNQG